MLDFYGNILFVSPYHKSLNDGKGRRKFIFCRQNRKNRNKINIRFSFPTQFNFLQDDFVSDVHCLLFHIAISVSLGALWGLAMFEMLNVYQQVKVKVPDEVPLVSITTINIVLFFLPGKQLYVSLVF